ncbi:MAG: hypothetical protein ACP5VR_09910 [Acidimicrobiales bacterium]
MQGGLFFVTTHLGCRGDSIKPAAGQVVLSEEPVIGVVVRRLWHKLDKGLWHRVTAAYRRAEHRREGHQEAPGNGAKADGR